MPTEDQSIKLDQWIGTCRFVYNLALETKIRAWTSAQKNVTCFDLMKQATVLRGEVDWIAECPHQSIESAITNLDSAYTSFFKRGAGFPNFRKRKGKQSIIFRRGASVKHSKIKLTKLGWVDFILHRPLGTGEIRTVTVTKTNTGKFFVSILVKDEKEFPQKAIIKPETSVGIDVGIKTFATLSDGGVFDNPKYLNEQLKRLRVEQRKLSKRRKKELKTSEQSKGWHKQKMIVAKLHEKIANKRLDFLHKTSTSIIKKYDTICIEDLNVSGMMKNSSLAKSISDVSWNEFFRQLQYKADWYGKNILTIGRFDPSSKICSNCGSIKKDLQLSEREWTCSTCNSTHDRDQNAAKNIKNFGLKNKPSTVNVSR